MDGGLRHPSAAAAGTESSAFAGEGDKVLMMAGLASGTQEAIGQNAAAEVFPKLLFDKVWEWVAGVSRYLGEEGFQIFGNDLVEESFLGPVALIGDVAGCRNGLHPWVHHAMPCSWACE